jgi:hypothetical protein
MKGLALELGRRNDPGGRKPSIDAGGRRAPSKASVDGHKCRRDGKQMHRSMAAVRNRDARLKIVVAKSRNQGLGLKAKGR